MTSAISVVHSPSEATIAEIGFETTVRRPISASVFDGILFFGYHLVLCSMRIERSVYMSTRDIGMLSNQSR